MSEFPSRFSLVAATALRCCLPPDQVRAAALLFLQSGRRGRPGTLSRPCAVVPVLAICCGSFIRDNHSIELQATLSAIVIIVYPVASADIVRRIFTAKVQRYFGFFSPPPLQLFRYLGAPTPFVLPRRGGASRCHHGDLWTNTSR